MDPLNGLSDWIDEARARGAPEPEAMALGTANAEGVPSVRIVLCRGVDHRGLRFFTNYESRKGREISENPVASACFFWPVLDRQVRVEGRVERLSAEESDMYFAQRPRGHQIGAWTSPQSQPLAGAEGIGSLRLRAERLAEEYAGQSVPRPPYWGGFLLRPTAIEVWTRGADRLHERTLFERHSVGWTSLSLAP